MFSSSPFDFCFRQAEESLSSGEADAPEHFSLSCAITTRILLIGTAKEWDDGPLLFPRAWLEENGRREFPNLSNAALHVSCYDESNNDGGSASALPPPETEEAFHGANETERRLSPHDSSHPELPPETPSALQKLQDALEHTGHQVVMWPSGMAFSVLARDLLDFEIVVVQDGARLEDAVSLCRILKAATTQSGTCLLASLSQSVAAREATPVARRVRALQEAGADGILDGDAPVYEIASVVRTMSQLARARRELKVTHEQLRLQLQTDDLTNLLNRRFFFQAAHREYERSQRTNSSLSCLMIDLDHFRRLTEGFGFECCDAALRYVANVLRNVARDGDIVARFGEGKFVFLLPETGLSQAVQIGELLQRAVSERVFVWRGQALPITVSVGEATRRVQSKANLFGADNAAPANAAPGALPLSESLEMRASFSARDEIAALLEEADAALFVAKRGVRSSSLLDTPPLSLSRPGGHENCPPA